MLGESGIDRGVVPRDAGAPDLLASQIEVYSTLVERLENRSHAYRKSFDSPQNGPAAELAPRSPIHSQCLMLMSLNSRLERLIDELDV